MKSSTSVGGIDNSVSIPRRPIVRYQKQASVSMAIAPESWYSIKRYYNKTVFIIFRCLGALVALLCVAMETIAVTTSCWYYGSMSNESFSEVGILGHFGHTKHLPVSDSIATWQKVSMGLIIASSFCGLFGFILNARGLCAKKIQQRLYYIHSAGEIYFVGGLCAFVVAVMYPTFVVQAVAGTIMPDAQLGFSYYFAVVGTILLLFCTFCMMLDELIQVCAQPRECIIECCFTRCSRCLKKCFIKHTEPALSDILPSGVVQVITAI